MALKYITYIYTNDIDNLKNEYAKNNKLFQDIYWNNICIRAFIFLFKRGYLDIIKYIDDIEKLLNSEFIHECYLTACTFGKLNVIKFLHEKKNVQHYDMLQGFEFACINNYIDVCNYIYDYLYSLDILENLNFNYIFNNLIVNGNYNMISYILNFNIDFNNVIIFDKYENILHIALKEKRLKIAKLIFYSYPHALLNNYAYEIFKDMCQNCYHKNRIDYIDWIYEKLKDTEYDIYENIIKNHEIFMEACETSDIQLCEYLKTIHNDYEFLLDEDDNEQISKYRVRNDLIFLMRKDDLYNKTEKLDDCQICLENKKFMVRFECNHEFCRDCIKENYNKKCSMCFKHIEPSKALFIINE